MVLVSYLCGTCVVLVWYLFDVCVVLVWYLCGNFVVLVRYLCGTCVVLVWYLCGTSTEEVVGAILYSESAKLQTCTFQLYEFIIKYPIMYS